MAIYMYATRTWFIALHLSIRDLETDIFEQGFGMAHRPMAHHVFTALTAIPESEDVVISVNLEVLVDSQAAVCLHGPLWNT